MSEEDYTGNPEHRIPGMISWTELFSQEPDESQAFYSQLFGWEIDEMEILNGTYTMFHCGKTPVAGLVKPTIPGLEASQWLNYITVTMLEEALEKCLALGGSVILEPTPLPQGRFAIIRDTQGTAVGLYEYGEQPEVT